MHPNKKSIKKHVIDYLRGMVSMNAFCEIASHDIELRIPTYIHNVTRRTVNPSTISRVWRDLREHPLQLNKEGIFIVHERTAAPNQTGTGEKIWTLSKTPLLPIGSSSSKLHQP